MLAGARGMHLARRFRVRWSLRGASRVLAVDIGSHSVKVVAARHQGASVRVEAAVVGALPAGAIHGHMVRDPAPVADVLRRLVREVGMRSRRAVTALPGPAVMMRRIAVEPRPCGGLDALVVREAAALVPEALEHVVLDYQVVGSFGADGTSSVLVVAARRDLVQSYTAAIRAAGLEPCGIEVDVFALDRLHRAGLNGGGAPAPVALVHVGARRADVTLARSDGPIFASDVPVGGAELDPGSLSCAIHRALDLCVSDAPAPLAGLVLSGGAARAPGLATALGRRLGCSVAVADPFRSVALGPRVDVDVLARIAPTFAIAMGLALRGPGTT